LVEKWIPPLSRSRRDNSRQPVQRTLGEVLHGTHVDVILVIVRYQLVLLLLALLVSQAILMAFRDQPLVSRVLAQTQCRAWQQRSAGALQAMHTSRVQPLSHANDAPKISGRLQVPPLAFLAPPAVSASSGLPRAFATQAMPKLARDLRCSVLFVPVDRSLSPGRAKPATRTPTLLPVRLEASPMDRHQLELATLSAIPLEALLGFRPCKIATLNKMAGW